MRFLKVALLACLPLGLFGSITSQVDKTGPFTISSSPQTIAVGFPFQQSSDLVVLDEGSTGTPRDPAAILVLGSDYTVSGGGYNSPNQMQTGSIVVSTGGTNNVITNDQIVIMRGVPINQSSSFSSTGPLTITLLEQSLDKMATLSQQVNEIGGRSLQFEPNEFLSPVLQQSLRENNLLGFGPTGNVVMYPQNAAANGIVSGSYVVATSGTTPITLANRFNSPFSVKDFGATGNGTTNDAAAINAAIQATTSGNGSSGLSQTLVFPPGTYNIGTSTIAVNKTCHIIGNGSTIAYSGTGTGVAITANDAVIDDLFVICTNAAYPGGGNTSGIAMSSLVGTGVSVTNCSDWRLNNVSVQGFAEGEYFSGNGAGCSLGVVDKIKIVDCYHAIHLVVQNANNSYVTAISFFGGDGVTSGAFLNKTGACNVLGEDLKGAGGLNGINFYGVLLEGSVQYKLNWNGNDSNFDGCYWDLGTTSTDITFQSLSFGNIITGGATLSQCSVTDNETAVPASNIVVDPVRDNKNFTPTVTGQSSAGTCTYTTQIGFIHKVGPTVFYTIELTWTGHTGTGNLQFNGLTYIATNLSGNVLYPATAILSTSAASYVCVASVAPNTQYGVLYVGNGGGAISNIAIPAAGSLWISGSYPTQGQP